MHDGIVEQIGSPLELYDRPANRFVAGFIGSPSMNFIDGQLDGDAVVAANGARLPVPSHVRGGGARPVVYGVRPEHLDLADDGFEAEVVVVEPTGSETLVFVRLGETEVVSIFRERHEFKPGQKIRLRPRAPVAHLFDPATGARL
jgi:multiple sugar transport system ATP-binding protein